MARTSVWVEGWGGDQAGVGRILVDVADQGFAVEGGFDGFGFETSAEEGAVSPAGTVEVVHVGVLDSVHGVVPFFSSV